MAASKASLPARRAAEQWRGYQGRTGPLVEAARTIPTVDLADLLCGAGGLRRVGREWTGRCPSPTHHDRSPSFCVNPEKDVWFSFACLRGGGIIELAAFAWSLPDRRSAALAVCEAFGVPLPAVPDSRHARNRRREDQRWHARQARIAWVRKRLYKTLFRDDVDRIADPEIRAEAEDHFWEATEPLARMLMAGGKP